MKRLLWLAPWAMAFPQERPDLSNMSKEAHAPLFRAPAEAKGAATQRLAATLPPVASAPVAQRNFIDQHLFGRMQRDGIPHAPLADDQEFLRRVMLDLTGRIPSPADVRAFLADQAADKRARLIDRLIESPAFADKWAYFYMDLLRANGKMMRGVNLFHQTLKDSFAADRPYDDLARSLIAASAKSNYVVAAANPIVREHVEGKPGEAEHPDDLRKIHQMDTHDEISILFGKVFLGINLSCIACHDGRQHLENVNQYLAGKRRADFYGQAAFFGRVRYIPHVEVKEAKMGHFTVDDGGAGYDTKADSMLRIKRMGGAGAPKFILTNEVPREGAEPREELGRMLTAHPQFARATVNLFWSRLMGIGMVEPWDEFDLARTDQATNPELLDALAAHFRASGHSIHGLFRVICNSSAYQLSARFPGEWNEAWTKYHARKFARMLSAEELHDSIALATERPGQFGGATAKSNAPVTTMAMQAAVPRAGGELKSFLQAFGQANRGTPAKPSQPSPLQPIMLMRSPVVTERVLAKKDSRVERLLGAYTDDRRVVEELFLATLSRLPSEDEKRLAVDSMKKDRRAGAENVQWALLNLAEFLYNF